MALDKTLPGIQNLKHVVVLMMENRSFEHMLGALKATNPAIDGLTGTESNPDTTGAKVTVQPLAEYQSQLDPDPNHHFAAVNLQIFNNTQHGPPLPATMQGFIASYFNQQQNTAHSHDILYYYKPEMLPVLTTLATQACRLQWLVRVDSGSDNMQSRLCSLRHLVRPGQHGYLLRREGYPGHLHPPARRRAHLQALLLRRGQLHHGGRQPPSE